MANHKAIEATIDKILDVIPYHWGASIAGCSDDALEEATTAFLFETELRDFRDSLYEYTAHQAWETLEYLVEQNVTSNNARSWDALVEQIFYTEKLHWRLARDGR